MKNNLYKQTNKTNTIVQIQHQTTAKKKEQNRQLLQKKTSIADQQPFTADSFSSCSPQTTTSSQKIWGSLTMETKPISNKKHKET